MTHARTHTRARARARTHTHTHTHTHTITIKAEEEANIYNNIRKSIDNEIDKPTPPKDWLHPADSVKITEAAEEQGIQIYTDGSTNENGVGAGRA